eukprot:TRINITY_DN7601_c0_g1_i1.p1 TRINITY_DN7601_c0_g1~~TRINITY_DN7601_c0_g1_i1.p1  ORF type:complete len:185 (-),score=54.81 TRINITY_DN7601_c0_g1_i1:53-607(-)
MNKACVCSKVRNISSSFHILIMMSVESCKSITDEVLKGLSGGKHIYRTLELGDYDKGFPELLPQLTASTLSREVFARQFHELAKHQDLIQTLVCEDRGTGRVVGTIRFFVEPKYIHNGGSVLHFEDLVVDNACRGHGIGTALVKIVALISQKRGCYKCLADARKELLPFYEKACLLYTSPSPRD